MKIRYFTKRGTLWMDFRDAHGKRHRVPTGATTQAQAEQAAPAILGKVLACLPSVGTIPAKQGPVGAIQPLVGLSLRGAFERACRQREKWIASKDRQSKEQDFTGLLTAPGLTEDSDCSVLTRPFMQAAREFWMAQPGRRAGTKLSASTINHRLSIASVLLDVADCAPHTVRFLSTKGTSRKRRTREEELKALTAWCLANHHRKGALELADLIQVALVTTARRGELLSLLWADVYFDKGIIIYRDTKNGTTREGILLPVVHRIFERLVKAGEVGPFAGLQARQVDALWATAREALGLKDDHEFVFHVATRHEGLSRLGDDNASAFMIKAFSGHKSIASADIYVKPSLDSQRAFAAKSNTLRDHPVQGKDA